MKLLITGSESFVGHYLKKQLLKKNIKFQGIDNISSKNSIKLDISKLDNSKVSFNNFNAIVHLAAVSSTNDFIKNPKKAFKVNLNGTFNIIRMAKKNKIKNIIFASSEWVYGELSKKKFYENHKIDLNKLGSEYAFSKFMGEAIIKFYCKLYNIRYVILRFGIIYGPRIKKKNWSAVENLALKVFKNERIVKVGSKKTARRFIYVKDVVGGIIKSINLKNNHIFNLSGDKLISLEDIIRYSNKVTKNNVSILESDKKNFNFRDTNNSKIKKILKWKQSFSFEKQQRKERIIQCSGIDIGYKQHLLF